MYHFKVVDSPWNFVDQKDIPVYIFESLGTHERMLKTMGFGGNFFHISRSGKMPFACTKYNSPTICHFFSRLKTKLKKPSSLQT